MSRRRGGVLRIWWLFLLFLYVLPVPARADNCGSLADCYGTILAAVIVAIALAVLLFFLWEAWAAGAAVSEAVGAGFAEGAAEVVGSRLLTPGQMGRIIGWGTGQAAAEVAQTQAVARTLTTEAVEAMIQRGVTRRLVESQLARYEASLAMAGRKLVNQQLVPRIELMRKILELWPP